MKKIKVLQTLYSGLGGHGNVVFSLLESEFKHSFDHSLVFYGVEEIRPQYIEQSTALSIPYFAIQKKPKQYLKSFRDFKRILKTERPDRIIIHSSELILPAVKYAKNNNCPVYYVEHEPNHSKTRLENFLSKYALKKASNVICLNESYKEELMNRYGKNENIVVIPNGVDTNLFKPSETNPQPYHIGMAARITDTKDHKNLLLAFASILNEYPKAKLSIAGTGNLLNAIKAQVAQLKITDHVHFNGLLNEDEMIAFYKSLDLYVHATKSETLSTSLLQAMSCGLPVITSDIKNNALLIEDSKTGYLYKDKNPESIALKIKTCFENRENTIKISTAARQHILTNFTSESMASKYKHLML